MKISNGIIMGGLWLANYLFPPAETVDEIYAHAEKHNKRQIFKIPKERWIDCEVMKVQAEKEAYPCLRMKKKGQRPDKAILYICGGGGVYDCCRQQLIFAKKFLKKTDGEIYYPFYPPSTRHPITEAYRMVFETYRAMLNEYSYEKIGVLGLSFGATAAMTMVSWNNYFKEGLPMPALIIGLSPGHVPTNRDERESLEAYRCVDPFIPVNLVEAYGQINRGGQDMERWLIHTGHGDFRKAGKIFLYFGEKESLAYAVPVYRQSLEKAGVDYKIHIEPGMPHCYGVTRINKASRKTYDEYLNLINSL
ncbi:MAG: alpha/beta hydrolase fold domain-containing protein [Lentihominibacter sp.]|jgi:monoterpene epsilon-lactone hydrolase